MSPDAPPSSSCTPRSTGFKAATKVTDAGKAYLKAALPPHACPSFDHRLSRYLKAP